MKLEAMKLEDGQVSVSNFTWLMYVCYTPFILFILFPFRAKKRTLGPHRN